MNTNHEKKPGIEPLYSVDHADLSRVPEEFPIFDYPQTVRHKWSGRCGELFSPVNGKICEVRFDSGIGIERVPLNSLIPIPETRAANREPLSPLAQIDQFAATGVMQSDPVKPSDYDSIIRDAWERAREAGNTTLADINSFTIGVLGEKLVKAMRENKDLKEAAKIQATEVDPDAEYVRAHAAEIALGIRDARLRERQISFIRSVVEKLDGNRATLATAMRKDATIPTNSGPLPRQVERGEA